MKVELVAANVGGKTRREELEGEEHLVVPAGMLAKGVWAGSIGPVLYKDRVLANSVPTWDAKPVVLYHPTKNGRMVSACNKEEMNKRKVGVILNTDYNGKLRSEAWINVKRCNSLDPRIVPRLENNKQVETSTGLKYKLTERAGVRGGKKYVAVVSRIVGDHLAILPKGEGAYAVKDGGGLLANRDFSTKERRRLSVSGVAMAGGGFPIVSAKDLKNAVQAFGRAKNKAATKRHIIKRARALGLTQSLPEKWRPGVTANELSFSDISGKLQELLASTFGQPGRYWSGYVCQVYPGEPGYVIFMDASGPDSLDRGSPDALWRMSYTADGDTVALDGKPEKVERVVEYRPVGNAADPPQPEDEEMAFDKKKYVGELIANGIYQEDDRESLMKTPDGILSKIPTRKMKLKVSKRPAEILANNAGDDEDEQEVEDAPAVKTKTPTLKEILANASAADRAAFRYGRRKYKQDRARFIKTILANKKNIYEKEYLESIEDLDQLEGLAALAKPDPDDDDDDDESIIVRRRNRADYSGAAGDGDVAANEGDVEILEEPELKFEDPRKKK